MKKRISKRSSQFVAQLKLVGLTNRNEKYFGDSGRKWVLHIGADTYIIINKRRAQYRIYSSYIVNDVDTSFQKITSTSFNDVLKLISQIIPSVI